MRNNSRGYTLLEVLIYTAVFALVLFAIVAALFAMVKATRHLTEERRVALSAHVALERITRDARNAAAVDAQSVLGSHPSTLIVETEATTTEFFLEDGALQVRENNVLQGALTHQDATVTSFIVYRNDSASSTSVRIELEIQAGTSTNFFSKRFYTTAVLRNAYE